MANVSLISGIMGGYGDTLLQRQDQAHQEAMEDKRNRLKILLGIDPSQIPESQRGTFAAMIDEMSGPTKGKGKGKAGEGGPFQKLFDHIAPLLDHLGGKGRAQQQQSGQMTPPPRPDGLANPVPNIDQSSMAQPAAQPGPQQAAAPPQVRNPGEVLRGGPAKLDEVPRPQSPQNVPQGTIHPEKPATLGQIWASQDPSRADQHAMEQRQAQADRFKATWEAKHGPLTQEQQDELMEWTMGMPAGFSRAGKTDKMIIHAKLGADGKPVDVMQRPDGSQYEVPIWEKPPATPQSRQTAKQMDRDNFIQGYKLTHPGATDEDATRQYYTEQYKQQHEKMVGMFQRNGLTGLEATRLKDDITNGNWTVKNTQKYLAQIAAEAKTRIANEMKEAKSGYPATNGQPGPDSGKTQEEIENEIIEDQGYNPESVRANAYSSVGNEPPAGSKKAAPSKPAAKSGGGDFNWDALPKASLPKAQ